MQLSIFLFYIMGRLDSQVLGNRSRIIKFNNILSITFMKPSINSFLMLLLIIVVLIITIGMNILINVLLAFILLS